MTIKTHAIGGTRVMAAVGVLVVRSWERSSHGRTVKERVRAPVRPDVSEDVNRSRGRSRGRAAVEDEDAGRVPATGVDRVAGDEVAQAVSVHVSGRGK